MRLRSRGRNFRPYPIDFFSHKFSSEIGDEWVNEAKRLPAKDDNDNLKVLIDRQKIPVIL